MFFSIITVSFNAEKTIARTVSSVAKQTFRDFEYLLIDGGSSDNTLRELSPYQHVFSTLISERDRGVYDAYNKGLDRAAGQWVLFLNADDQFSSENTLETLHTKLQEAANTGVVLGLGQVKYDDGKIFRCSMGPAMLIKNTMHHQGVVYSRKLFLEYRYNADRKIAGDYEYNLQLYLQKVPYTQLGLEIAICGVGGLSKQGYKIGYMEEMAFKAQLLPWFFRWMSLLPYFKFLVKTISK